MKTRKHRTYSPHAVFGMAAIIAIIGLAFTACDDGNGNTHTHDWGDWEETTLPTITEDGIETRVCKSDPSHKETRKGAVALATPFFGTWYDTAGRVLTISANSIRLELSSGNYLVTGSCEWSSITVEHRDKGYFEQDDPKEYSPNGYTITGPIIDTNYSTGETISLRLFLHNDKQSFCYPLNPVDITNSNYLYFHKHAPDPCNCLTTHGATAHLAINEICRCGGFPCNCTEQTDTVLDIPIYKYGGITVQQMNDNVAVIKTAMNDEAFTNTDMWKLKGLNEIHIMVGNSVDFQHGILTVGADAEYPHATYTGEKAKLVAIVRKLSEIYDSNP